MPKRISPYNLAPGFECAVVTLACSVPRFFGRIGHELDPELLAIPACKLALQAAQQFNRDVGHGPDAAVLVLQRLRRWMEDGKVSFEAIRAVSDMFDDSEDAGLINEDSLVAELAPMLSLRIRDEAVGLAIESGAKHGDLSKVVALEGRAERMGQVDTSVGTILGNDSFAEIVRLSELERLKTGVVELDNVLDGGLQRAGLGVVIGGSGDGKSMMLSHISGVSMLAGLHVAYATLELPVPVVLARLKSNLTGVPINSILGGGLEECRMKLATMAGKLGRCVVQEFTPHVTTVDDIRTWVSRVEEQAKCPIDVLVVDYGDKLVGKEVGKKGGSDGEYHAGRVVFEALRIWANDQKKFCWTASQANRQKDRKKRLDLNDVADSMHKIRVADLVVTLNLQEDSEGQHQMIFYVAKHRTGRSRVQVGPLPVEYECGRVCSVVTDADGYT